MRQRLKREPRIRSWKLNRLRRSPNGFGLQLVTKKRSHRCSADTAPRGAGRGVPSFCETPPRRTICSRGISPDSFGSVGPLTVPRARHGFGILQMTYRRAISRRRYLTSSRHFYTYDSISTDAASQLADPRISVGQLEDSIDGGLGEWQSSEGSLSRLRRNQRQTLRLFFIEGYTLEEIAATLGQSRWNVKTPLLFRGLDRLRRGILWWQVAG